MSENSITLIGNLIRDPEIRYLSSGAAVTSFGLAVNRRYKKGDDWQEETGFYDITCWGDLGENCAASLGKGNRVVVTGRLNQRSWETDDGQKRSAINIVADDVGAALRWATVQIERTERTKASSPSAPSGGGEYPEDEIPF